MYEQSESISTTAGVLALSQKEGSTPRATYKFFDQANKGKDPVNYNFNFKVAEKCSGLTVVSEQSLSTLPFQFSQYLSFHWDLVRIENERLAMLDDKSAYVDIPPDISNTTSSLTYQYLETLEKLKTRTKVEDRSKS